MLFWCLVSWASGFSVFLSPVWKQSEYTLSMCTSQFSFSHPSHSPHLSPSLLTSSEWPKSPWELLHEKQMPKRLNGVQIRAGFKEVLNIKRFTQPHIHTHTHKIGAQVFDTYALGISLCPFPLFLSLILSISPSLSVLISGLRDTGTKPPLMCIRVAGIPHRAQECEVGLLLSH